MKKAAALLLALSLCFGPAAPALADGGAYGVVTFSGANDMYTDRYMTEFSFSSATLEFGTVRFADIAPGGQEADPGVRSTEREVNILTVQPGSAFTVNLYQDGKLKTAGFSQLRSEPYIDAGTLGYLRRGAQSAPSVSSGTVDDWFGAWDEPPAMIWFKLGEAEYCVFPGESVVRRSAQRVTVDGAPVTPQIYNIDGYNYFKLRDLAMLLKDTSARFSVDFDAAAQTISVTTGADYVPDGSELTNSGDDAWTLSRQSLTIDGKPVRLSAYNIGGSNYFKLADLGPALNFGVDYNAETNTAIITTK